MSPTLFSIIALAIFGVIAMIFEFTKLGKWTKKVMAWAFCACMILGIIGFFIKAAAFIITIIVAFFAKIFS